MSERCVICGHVSEKLWPRKNSEGKVDMICNAMCSAKGSIVLALIERDPTFEGHTYARELRAAYFEKHPLKQSLWRKQ